jgi:hypothetical protein
MKIVKVHIRRGHKGENMMVYPALYDAEEVDRSGLGPCGINGTGAYSGAIGAGGAEEHCLILVEDEVADRYVTDPEMEVITAEEADALMEQWRLDNEESEEVVTDVTRIQAIAAKQAAGITLSAEDRAALDPTSLVRGINKRLKKMSVVVAKTGKTLTPHVKEPK